MANITNPGKLLNSNSQTLKFSINSRGYGTNIPQKFNDIATSTPLLYTLVASRGYGTNIPIAPIVVAPPNSVVRVDVSTRNYGTGITTGIPKQVLTVGKVKIRISPKYWV